MELPFFSNYLLIYLLSERKYNVWKIAEKWQKNYKFLMKYSSGFIAYMIRTPEFCNFIYVQNINCAISKNKHIWILIPYILNI